MIKTSWLYRIRNFDKLKLYCDDLEKKNESIIKCNLGLVNNNELLIKKLFEKENKKPKKQE